MVIVYEKAGEFWIDAINITRTALAAGADDNINISISRPGDFLGVAISFDSDIADVVVGIRRRDGTNIPFGSRIDDSNNSRGLEVTRHNFNAAEAQIGFHVILLMRKFGRSS